LLAREAKEGFTVQPSDRLLYSEGV
jgi:hypothetical protein